MFLLKEVWLISEMMKVCSCAMLQNGDGGNIHVWGELDRSLTHCPSSQGFASKCPVFVYVCVGLFIWVTRLGSFLLPLCTLSASVLYTCIFSPLKSIVLSHFSLRWSCESHSNFLYSERE